MSPPALRCTSWVNAWSISSLFLASKISIVLPTAAAAEWNSAVADSATGLLGCRNTAIAEAIGMSEHAVIRAVRALEARGHLRIKWGKPGRGHSNEYWMLDREPDLFADLKPAPAQVLEDEKPAPAHSEKSALASKKPALASRKPAPAQETLSKTHRRTIEGERLSPAVRFAGKKKE